MYLANDVIQNSKKKGPEYGLEFGKVLKKAFAHIGETCCRDEKTLSSLGRILIIWEDRGVYDGKIIQEFRNALNRETNGKDEPASKSGAPSSTAPNSSSTSSKRKATDSTAISSTENGKEKETAKKSKSSSSSAAATSSGGAKERGKRETIEVNGAIETHVILSPKAPAGDPPEPEELIKALLDLESSASSDANIREQIANLPPAVSEVSELSKLQNKEAAAELAKTVNMTFVHTTQSKEKNSSFVFALIVCQVDEAAQILHDYNMRLSVEMEDRKKLTAMLRDFQAEQKELLAQAEQRLEVIVSFYTKPLPKFSFDVPFLPPQEYNKKLIKVKDVQKEIKNHLNNLPDLTQLPDVTGGLAPLPSAGDLFSIH